MIKNIFFAALIVSGLVIYRTQFYRSPAYKAYVRFSEAVRAGKCNDMKALSEGQASAFVDGLCTPPPSMTVFGKTISMPSAASMINDMASTPSGAMMRIIRKVESESEKNGEVELKVIEKPFLRNTPPSQLAPPSLCQVKLKKTGGAWRVIEYSDTPVK